MGLTIYGLSERCGVSYVALSKLERNLGNPELRTLDKIARALNIETHNLLALAEHDRPRIVDASHEPDRFGFDVNWVDLEGVRISMVRGPAGTKGGESHEHRDDCEFALLLKGRMALEVRGTSYEVNAGQGVKFDCIFEHTYELLEDSEFVHVVVSKRK